MEEEEAQDGTTPSPLSLRTSRCCSEISQKLMERLAFPGNCKDKTGPDAKKFSSEYKDFLGKSFETQTWVYEQAVSAWRQKG